MKFTGKPLTHDDYTVGWISALPLEMAAAKAMLDVIHPWKLPQSPNDHNTYTLGSAQGHNVVIACLPAGVYGTTSAAIVAAHMLFTFRALRFGLMVGIGGGVPTDNTDIRLGDVVVSKPTDTFGGVVQYDYGKTVNGGIFQRTGCLNKSPQVLLTAVASLQAQRFIDNQGISMFLSRAASKYPAISWFSNHGQYSDHLYQADYDHIGSEKTCRACDKGRLVTRSSRSSQEPEVHYGLIASGNQVMKHGATRDRLARELGILCFEMEAAGLMDQFPCLVIRGICDYSDSHKNKEWQGYAAATAAGYAMELLSVVSTQQVWRTEEIRQQIPMALVSLTGSIVGFLDVSNAIMQRLVENHSSAFNSTVFENVSVELPLIVNTVKEIDETRKDSCMSPETQDALVPVLENCLQQISLLEKLTQKTLPMEGDSRLQRLRKAVARRTEERAILSCLKILGSYKSTLTFHLSQKSGAAIARLMESEQRHADVNASDFDTVQQQNRRLLCERWLKPPLIISFAKPKLPETCEWIWKEPAFVEWMTPLPDSGRLLCVYGVHGCGKSVLAASIAKVLNDERREALFFSFSGADGHRKSLESLARTLLWQLFEQTSNREVFEIVDALRHQSPITTPELFDAITVIARLRERPVYCIIDGVDECADECNDPARGLLKEVLRSLKRSRLHVALIGRPYALEGATGETSLNIEMTPVLTRADIEKFIRVEISGSPVLESQTIQNDVVKLLREKSDGMFLWVKLMIDDLRKSATIFEAKERLESTPRGLEQLYRVLFLRLVDNLDAWELRLATTVLAFTVASCRPLTVDELCYSYALHIDPTSTFEDHLLLQPEQRIGHVCGGLVHVVDGHVQTVHISVNEFLTRPEEQWCRANSLEIECFRVDLQKTHRSLGNICLDYLTSGDYELSTDSSNRHNEQSVRFPFTNYATRHAMSHLVQSEPPCQAIIDKVNWFFDSQRFPVWMEYLAMILIDDLSGLTFSVEVDIFSSWIQKGGYAWEPFELKLCQVWERELDHRINLFGENDPRTERWQNFSPYIKGSELIQESQHMDISLDDEPGDSTLNPSDAILQVLNATNDGAVLTLPTQTDFVFKLQQHLRRARVLTDPLTIMLESILKAAHRVPVLAIISIANFYQRINRPDNALRVYQAARARTVGDEKPIKYWILTEIGDILESKFEYADAAAMYQQAVEGRERLLGRMHAGTVYCMSKLAWVLSHQEKYQDSEVILKRTIQLQEQTLGPEYPDTAFSMGLLGFAILKQGRYPEAERIIRKAIRYLEKTRGPDDSYMLATKGWLGSANDMQGRYQEAESIFREVLEHQQRAKGHDHSDTLSTMEKLGNAIYEQGRNEEAESIYKNVIEHQQRAGRHDHFDVFGTMNNLGNAVHNQKRYEEAKSIFKNVIEHQQRLGRHDHRETLRAMHCLAQIFAREKRYHEAELLLKNVVKAHEKSLGRDHPRILEFTRRLALWINQQGRPEEARVLYEQVLESSKRVHGKLSPHTLSDMNDLGWALSDEEKYERAEELFRELVQVGEAVLSKEDPLVRRGYEGLAWAAYRQGHYLEAEIMYMIAVEKQIKAPEKGLAVLFDFVPTLHDFGWIYFRLGRYGEARRMYESAVQQCEMLEARGIRHSKRVGVDILGGLLDGKGERNLELS